MWVESNCILTVEERSKFVNTKQENKMVDLENVPFDVLQSAYQLRLSSEKGKSIQKMEEHIKAIKDNFKEATKLAEKFNLQFDFYLEADSDPYHCHVYFDRSEGWDSSSARC
jgi:hypothetical protein